MSHLAHARDRFSSTSPVEQRTNQLDNWLFSERIVVFLTIHSPFIQLTDDAVNYFS